MTSNFAPEVAEMNSSKVAPNPQIAQNSVRAYCLALLSNAASQGRRSEKNEWLKASEGETRIRVEGESSWGESSQKL